MRVLLISYRWPAQVGPSGPGLTRRLEEALTRYYPDRIRLASAYMDMAEAGSSVEPGKEGSAPAARTGTGVRFEQDGILYYPLRTDLGAGSGTACWEESKKLLLDVVEDFRPDLVQCFGTEWPYGAIAENLSVPVLIHMMGFLNIYYDSLDMVRGYSRGLDREPGSPPAGAENRPGGGTPGRSAGILRRAKEIPMLRAGFRGLRTGFRALGTGIQAKMEGKMDGRSCWPGSAGEQQAGGQDSTGMIRMGGKSLRPEEVYAAFERRVMKANRYFMGRTAWDRNIVRYYADDAVYFHVPELMKPGILEAAGRWRYKNTGKLRLLTISSADDRKGNEIILRTGLLLKNLIGLDFCWRVAGAREFFPFFENRTGIRCADARVELLGPIGQDQIVRELVEADLFIHPSIMDNSPNSVCEAQLVGCPVIASNVGGTPQIVEDGKTGFLYPYNEPHTLAFLIAGLYGKEALLTDLSRRETAMAAERHDPAKIADLQVRVYEEILEDYEKKKQGGKSAASDPRRNKERQGDRDQADLEADPLHS